MDHRDGESGDRRDVPELAAAIADADAGRATPQPPLTRGWAGLVERDRRARARSSPNAAGGFAGILYPWRLLIAIAGGMTLVALVILSLLE